MEERNSNRKSEKINESLPLRITTSDIENNPEFTKLLTSLCDHITENGCSIQTQRDFKQAEDELRHEKHTWLLSKVLYGELCELLLDYDIKSQEISLSSEDQQYITLLQEFVSYAESECYLDCSPDPSCKITLFGLQKEDLQRCNVHKKDLPVLSQKLIPEIEERLRAKCENLADFHSPSNAENTKLAFARASQLPAFIEAEKQRLLDEKKALKQDLVQHDKQFHLYYQSLLDSLYLLEKLIAEFRLRNQAENNKITSEWLIARCDGLCLKLKVLELQVLCDIYTEETMKALLKIKKYMYSEIDDRQKEKERCTHVLQTYESVGSEFDQIVQEYGKLSKELENKHWAVNEMQNLLKRDDN